jgi:hypothetical protein
MAARKMSDTKLEEWHFDFGLCGPDGKLVPQSDCAQLLEVIVDWAEEHGFHVGGGYGPFAEPDE